MIQPRIIKTDEPRIYMGSKWSVIPRGSIVRLVMKILWSTWRVGVVEYKGRKYVVLIRALWKLYKLKTIISKLEEG